eukprot:s1962_g8.t1
MAADGEEQPEVHATQEAEADGDTQEVHDTQEVQDEQDMFPQGHEDPPPPEADDDQLMKKPAASKKKATPKPAPKVVVPVPKPSAKAAIAKAKAKLAAKAKAKLAAKATAKSAAKAAAKAAAKSGSSKPFFEYDDGEEEQEPTDGEQPEEEEPKEEDQVVEDEDEEEEEARDRVKARKFQQMMKDGLLPAAAEAAYKKCQGRAEQTRLINSLFKLQGRKLVVQDQFRLPKAYEKTMEASKVEKAQDLKDGFGKVIFMKKMNLTEDELEACVASGEVTSWESNGLQLFAATNQATNQSYSSASSKNEMEKMTTGKVNLKKDQQESFWNVFKHMQTVLSDATPKAKATESKRKLPKSEQFLWLYARALLRKQLPSVSK